MRRTEETTVERGIRNKQVAERDERDDKEGKEKKRRRRNGSAKTSLGKRSDDDNDEE